MASEKGTLRLTTHDQLECLHVCQLCVWVCVDVFLSILFIGFIGMGTHARCQTKHLSMSLSGCLSLFDFPPLTLNLPIKFLSPGPLSLPLPRQSFSRLSVDLPLTIFAFDSS